MQSYKEDTIYSKKDTFKGSIGFWPNAWKNALKVFEHFCFAPKMSPGETEYFLIREKMFAADTGWKKKGRAFEYRVCSVNARTMLL